MNKLSDEALRLKSIFESSVDGIIIINTRGIIESANPAACAQFQYIEDELIGHNVNILMPSPHRKQHDGYLRKYQETGEKKIIGIGREVKGQRKDGSKFPFNLSVSEVRMNDKIIYTGFIHDISDLKNAQEELLELARNLENKVKKRTLDLAEAIKEVEATNRDLKKEIQLRKLAEEDAQSALLKELELGELKSRFVSMASHEFRTPLTGILSSISLISKYSMAEQEEKKQKHVKRIKSAVQNLTSILNDFLSLDKLQAGKINCHPEWFNIVEFMNAMIEESDQLKKAGQQLDFLLENLSTNDDFFTDKHILKNILLNLVSNAIKYSEEFDPIKIILKKEKELICIEVIDQGIGIPLEDQKRMFERFFRAKNASNIQGTGLGLSIVFEYINLLQGRISFESAEQIGSTFTLEIPNYKIKNK